MEKPIEIMRIVRRPPLGQLVVENNGRQYEKIDEINNQQLSQMVLAAVGDLVAFVGGYKVLVDAGFAPELVTVADDEPSLEKQQAAFLAQLQQRNPTNAAQDGAASPSLFRRRKTTAVADEVSALDIAGALDDLFQKHLTRMPELSSEHVRVETNLRGGTRINVNGRYYDEPAAIPNPMIRLAYKMAVREWEKAGDVSVA